MPAIKKVLILHGWEGDPSLHWIPEAKKMFEEAGLQVFTPKLPGKYFPKKEEWLNIIREYRPDSSWALIGHSLGGVALLKYLEDASSEIGQAILIAAAFEPMKFTPIANFFQGGFNWQKIKNNCPRFDVIIESNDPVVPTDHGQKLAEKLNSQLYILPGYSHFHSIDLDFLRGLIK